MLKSIVHKSTIGGFVMYFRRLRDLREDNDLNQAQIGEILGISQTVYSRYERGYQTIPLEHLINLAAALSASTLRTFSK